MSKIFFSKTLSSYSRNYFFLFMYEQELLCEAMIEACMYQKKRRNSPWQNRYTTYLSRSLALRKEEIEINDNSRPHFKFPTTTLEFIRANIPGNLKGEIWIDAFEVSRETCIKY